jgi:hypothetical protein
MCPHHISLLNFFTPDLQKLPRKKIPKKIPKKTPIFFNKNCSNSARSSLQNDGHLLAISEQETAMAMAEKGDVGGAGLPRETRGRSRRPVRLFPKRHLSHLLLRNLLNLRFSFPDPHSSRVYLKKGNTEFLSTCSFLFHQIFHLSFLGFSFLFLE